MIVRATLAYAVLHCAVLAGAAGVCQQCSASVGSAHLHWLCSRPAAPGAATAPQVVL
jgi:hypothetical protein